MNTTFHDIDGTEYGPKEYNADKISIELAKQRGEYIPYDLKRRVKDYELGINPFDRQYQKPRNKDSEHPVLNIIAYTFLIWLFSAILFFIISLFIDVRAISWICSEILPFVPPVIFVIYSIKHFDD